MNPLFVVLVRRGFAVHHHSTRPDNCFQYALYLCYFYLMFSWEINMMMMMMFSVSTLLVILWAVSCDERWDHFFGRVKKMVIWYKFVLHRSKFTYIMQLMFDSSTQKAKLVSLLYILVFRWRWMLRPTLQCAASRHQLKLLTHNIAFSDFRYRVVTCAP